MILTTTEFKEVSVPFRSRLIEAMPRKVRVVNTRTRVRSLRSGLPKSPRTRNGAAEAAPTLQTH
jgi:hypothetical protein